MKIPEEKLTPFSMTEIASRLVHSILILARAGANGSGRNSMLWSSRATSVNPRLALRTLSGLASRTGEWLRRSLYRHVLRSSSKTTDFYLATTCIIWLGCKWELHLSHPHSISVDSCVLDEASFVISSNSVHQFMLINTSICNIRRH